MTRRTYRQGMTRGRYVLIALAGLATTPLAQARQAHSDWPLFSLAGRVLFGMDDRYPSGLHSFAAFPQLQVGPLALLPVRGLDAAFGSHAQTAAGVLSAALAVLCVWLCEQTVRAWGSRPNWSLTIGGLILAPLFVEAAGSWGHLEDVLALTAIMLGLWLLTRSTDALAAGAAFGLAAAFKPWAIIAVGLLAVAGRREAVRGAAAAVAVAVVWWLPFIFADPAGVRGVVGFHHLVLPGSSLHLLGVPFHAPGWVRMLQLALAIALSALTVRRGRLAAALLVAMAVRVALDPGAFAYYGIGPVLAALMWDATSERRLPVWTLTTGVALYAVPSLGSTASEVVRLVWAAAVICAALGPGSPADRSDDPAAGEHEWNPGKVVEVVAGHS